LCVLISVFDAVEFVDGNVDVLPVGLCVEDEFVEVFFEIVCVLV